MTVNESKDAVITSKGVDVKSVSTYPDPGGAVVDENKKISPADKP